MFCLGQEETYILVENMGMQWTTEGTEKNLFFILLTQAKTLLWFPTPPILVYLEVQRLIYSESQVFFYSYPNLRHFSHILQNAVSQTTISVVLLIIFQKSKEKLKKYHLHSPCHLYKNFLYILQLSSKYILS